LVMSLLLYDHLGGGGGAGCATKYNYAMVDVMRALNALVDKEKFWDAEGFEMVELLNLLKFSAKSSLEKTNWGPKVNKLLAARV
jgi:hypothetical protein